MTPQEIKQSLQELEEWHQGNMRSYLIQKFYIQDQCSHPGRTWSHSDYGVEYGYEHYFEGQCTVCGDVTTVEQNETSFPFLMEKYWNGEIE